ncbi:MAG: DUF3553 domain-containing protein, partial [Herbiconiux sp.]|nr:DUF3553 domain-containing protein [Herbiconiux sp.]
DAARVREVVRALAPRGRRRRLERSAVESETGLATRSAGGILNLLIEAGVADENAEGVSLTCRITQKAAVEAVQGASDKRHRIEESRLTMVRGYAETLGCRRQFLLGYFGDVIAGPCGNCDTCERGTAVEHDLRATASSPASSASSSASSSPSPDASPDEATPPAFTEGERVVHASWGEGEVVSVERDRLTAFFENEGYRVLSLAAVAEHALLRPAP